MVRTLTPNADGKAVCRQMYVNRDLGCLPSTVTELIADYQRRPTYDDVLVHIRKNAWIQTPIDQNGR